jgi:phospholipid N-methyltransferase
MLSVVFLTDAKRHPKPGVGPIEGSEAEKVAARINKAQEIIETTAQRRADALAHNRSLREPKVAVPREVNPEDEKFKTLKDTLKNGGVQVVSAPQLFPTPVDLACRMAELAGISAGSRVLEPSAGTGRLVQQILEHGCFHEDLTMVEINGSLAQTLRTVYPTCRMFQDDFLELTVEKLGRFDVILMNPPFANGQDIAHIKYARKFLHEHGILVAICANGPRQNEALQPLADSWEVLPAGTFTESGTNVNTVLLTMLAEEVTV